jgi:hypothetical protein
MAVKILRMTNDKGEDVKEAYPSDVVNIYGFHEVLKPGDLIKVINNYGSRQKDNRRNSQKNGI